MCPHVLEAQVANASVSAGTDVVDLVADPKNVDRFFKNRGLYKWLTEEMKSRLDLPKTATSRYNKVKEALIELGRAEFNAGRSAIKSIDDLKLIIMEIWRAPPPSSSSAVVAGMAGTASSSFYSQSMPSPVGGVAGAPNKACDVIRLLHVLSDERVNSQLHQICKGYVSRSAHDVNLRDPWEAMADLFNNPDNNEYAHINEVNLPDNEPAYTILAEMDPNKFTARYTGMFNII
jgi:hypothetical protein